ncbi:hypothetical protein J3F83DRAFT_709255 [Trichoderma novae-zelandiae]
MGGSSKKNRRKNPVDDNGVDLLTLAFNIPTRRDFERAEREVAQDEIHTQGVRVQYNAGENGYSDAEPCLVSHTNIARPDSPDADETPKARKPFKPRHQHQSKEQTATVHASSFNDRLKASTQEPPPMRRPSRRESSSKPSKARERASSSPASFRAPSPAFSIPASATFPRTVLNYAQQGANFTASDAFTRPAHPGIGGGAQPQQYYQPMFAYPAVSVYPPTTQYYSTVPSEPVPGGPQYEPFPMTQKPSTNTHATPKPASLVSQQVQDIQSKLDEVVTKLSQHPEDAILKSTLSALQTELNTKLNSLLGMESRKESKVSEAPEPHKLKTRFSQAHAVATQQEKSPKKRVRHHLCTGCGDVRSSDYHDKHPIVPGGKPSMNYCEDCFEENVENGELEHHFCYGCGAARSREFHRNHPISKGDRPFPNYCSVCVEEVRSAETIADVSMVNFTPGNRSYKTGAYYDAVRYQSQGNKSINSFGPLQEMSNEEDQPDVLLFSAHSDTSEQVHPRGQKKIPNPLKLSTSGPQLSPSNSSPDSPYYPVRHAGTSQRRAHRSPLTSPASQYCSSPDTPTAPKYQPPYVEDVISPTQETEPQFEDSQFHPTTPGRQHPQDERPHHSTKAAKPGSPQEASDGSTEGPTSTDDSAHSTGSKSVKFRPKVDIRLSDSRTSSNASSHAQIVEEDIKPDEDTIPSRVGIYGTSPVKLSNGYYPRCQTPYDGPSSLATEDGSDEAIPERSYRGAFSKDSPASSWLPPTSSTGDHWYSRPSAYHTTTSPSTESFTGYRPGGRSTFNYGSGGSGMGGTGVPPPLRPTGSSPADPGTREESESQKAPNSPNSGPQHQTFSGSPSNGWKYYSSPYGGGQTDESTFRKPSPWSTFSPWFDPECHTMRDDSSFSQSAFSDYSQPSSNPYYQPRKRSFPDLSSYCSFGTQTRRTPGNWAKEYRSTTTKAPRPTPYWIPEPIIEEPDSPDSSPVKKANMLEFNIEISPKSASNTATSSSHGSVEEDLNHVAGSETDDGSDEENDLSNSSLDTPSLD